MQKTKFKELECLFAWAEFYSNSKTLATPTQFNLSMYNNAKKQIQKLQKQIID